MAHTLSLLQCSPYPSRRIVCSLCWEGICGPLYHCSDCDFDLHVACAAMATLHTHFTHPNHPLHLTFLKVGSRPHTCDSCGFSIRSWAFRCHDCDFDIHPVCAKAPRFIIHPRHSHPLKLLNSAGVDVGAVRCDGCLNPITYHFYACRDCQFRLHQACATAFGTNRVKHMKHQPHILKFVDAAPFQDDSRANCRDCGKLIEGWHLSCTTCSFKLHPVCAKIVHELPHCNNSQGDECESAMTASTSAHHLVRSSISLPKRTVSLASLHPDVPSDDDWEAMKRILRFAEEMKNAAMAREAKGDALVDCKDLEQEQCPTCLEGFDPMNPRKIMSCGHSFHMPCIMGWLERSSSCPICRSHLNIKL